MKNLFIALLSLALVGSLSAAVGDGTQGGSSTDTAVGNVRSPDGVYTISVDHGVTTVAALAGTVEIVQADGTSIKVDIGTGVVFNADGTKSTMTLAQIVAAEGPGAASNPNSVTASLAQAVQTLSDNVRGGAYGAGATTLLAAVVKVVSVANPAGAAGYVGTAVSAATSSTSAVADKSNAIRAIAEAAGDSVTSREMAIKIANAASYSATVNGMYTNEATNTATDGLVANQTVTQAAFGKNAMTSTTPITPIDPTVVSPSGGKK